MVSNINNILRLTINKLREKKRYRLDLFTYTWVVMFQARMRLNQEEEKQAEATFSYRAKHFDFGIIILRTESM